MTKRSVLTGTLPVLALALTAWLLLDPGEGVPTLAVDAPVHEAVNVRPEDPLYSGGDPAELPRLLGGHVAQRPGSAADPRRASDCRSALGRARGWLASLGALAGAREGLAPEALLDLLDRTFRSARDPVVRQNLIFHVALALPAALAGPWLEGVRGAEDPDDAEDALAALAFGGDAAARGRFAALAHEPAAAEVHRLVSWLDDHEALASEEGRRARAILRSYRAIEALDRVPYFKRTSHEVRVAWEPRAPADAAESLALLVAWLARYPGHPGSDDVALRVARIHSARGEHVEAARWYSRSSVWPDQDVTHGALAGLLTTAELLLTIQEVEALARSEGERTPNRALLRYVALRRTAATEGFARALADAAWIARDDPDSSLGEAWRRHVAPPQPPRVLEEEDWRLLLPDPERMEPLPPSSLERNVPSRVYGATRWSGAGQGEEGALDPWPEAIVLDVDSLERQLNTWTELASLEREADRARGEARGALLYEQAATFYHDAHVLFPVYAGPGRNFPSLLSVGAVGGRIPDAGRLEEARVRFEKETYSYARAIDLFRRIEAEEPGYAAMDKVVFSRGMAWKRLVDYGPYDSWAAPGGWEALPGRRADAIREVVSAMETCARRFPLSPLADDALRAATFWRTKRPELFR